MTVLSHQNALAFRELTSSGYSLATAQELGEERHGVSEEAGPASFAFYLAPLSRTESCVFCEHVTVGAVELSNQHILARPSVVGPLLSALCFCRVSLTLGFCSVRLSSSMLQILSMAANFSNLSLAGLLAEGKDPCWYG